MFACTKFELVKPKTLKRDYKLISGTDAFGSITFKKSFGTLAEAGVAGQCWSFKRIGFFNTKVTIRNCGDKNDLATFINNTWKGGGTLYFKDGTSYKANTNFWNSEFGFQSPKGKKLLKISTKGFLKTSTLIEINKGGEVDPKIELLVLLACYLSIMIRQDEMMAATGFAIGG
jgi:hypothetical protein